MPYKRRMAAPINSIKHYVQTSNTAIASGADLNINVVKGVVAPATSTTDEVIQGAVVKAIFFEYWIGGNAATANTSQFNFVIEKAPGNTALITTTNMANLAAYLNKKNILFTTQGQIGAQVDGNQSIPVIRGWLRIPKGKQRFGLDDRIVVSALATGSIRICGFVTYKEYR